MKLMKLVLLFGMTAAGSMQGMALVAEAAAPIAEAVLPTEVTADQVTLEVIVNGVVTPTASIILGALPTAATLYFPVRVMMKWAEDDLVGLNEAPFAERIIKARLAARKLLLSRVDKSLGEASEEEALAFYESRVQPLVALYKKLESQKENAVTQFEAKRIVKFMSLLEEYSKVGDARLGKIKLELGAKTAGAEESKENS